MNTIMAPKVRSQRIKKKIYGGPQPGSGSLTAPVVVEFPAVDLRSYGSLPKDTRVKSLGSERALSTERGDYPPDPGFCDVKFYGETIFRFV